MIDRWSYNVSSSGARIRSAIFGDRIGVIIFLGATIFYVFHWRIDFFINDNYTIANTLVGVADGHLNVDEIVYGPDTAVTPGMTVVDGHLYGRNYGQVFLALPFLWLLQAITKIADLTIAIASTWSLAFLVFWDQLGAELDRRQKFAFVGIGLATLTFAINVNFARPLDSNWIPLMALQMSTFVSAAFISVVIYRLLEQMHGQRIGIFAGVAVAVATPAGVWAVIPKRHTVTALFAMLALYCFYRSREAPVESAGLPFRALSYVWAGMTAWVHAPEGAVLLATIGSIDFLTARSNRPTRLVVVGVVFIVSLVPLMTTNYLVSGEALTVPRMLSSYHGEDTILGLDTAPDGAPDDSVSGGFDGGEREGGNRGFSPHLPSGMNPTVGILSALFGLLTMFTNQLTDGMGAILRAEVLGQTFIRRGNPEYWKGRGQAVNLAVLESMPLAALLALIPFGLYRYARKVSPLEALSRPSSLGPERVADLFAATYVLFLVLMYAPRVPVHASVTVRYLHPAYPFIVYFICRQNVVQAMLSERPQLLVSSYTAFVLIGGQLFVVVLVSLVTSPGEAVQLHGIVALAAAGSLVGWVTISSIRRSYGRTGAILMALTSAVTTLFIILSSHVYFDLDRQAIPVARLFSEALSFM